MSKFTAKQRNPGERCFVYDEDGELIIELKRPADLAHAEAVEKFLNDNVARSEESDGAGEEVVSCMTHASISLWRTAT